MKNTTRVDDYDYLNILHSTATKQKRLLWFFGLGQDVDTHQPHQVVCTAIDEGLIIFVGKIFMSSP